VRSGKSSAADRAFTALADPTRRHLLDLLHERNGQTLGELCAHVHMARQSVTQHLAVLEAANLISTVWQGRAKLHYLNPVPLHEIQDRWINKFERPRLRTLRAVQRRAEDAMSDRPRAVYVTYIESTAEKVWDALIDADLTAEYWGHSNVSDWKVGSRWEHVRPDGSGIADGAGTVLVTERPRKLVMTFGDPGEEPADELSRVTFDVEPHGDIVRLTVTHEELDDQAAYEAAASGWPAVLANLKSLLETGHVLPQAPWEMHAELREAHMAKNG
jgi:uncharacterized protein YndB with AHSA1/START domain/DNA-binding transcriptional ArsR family regulator